MAVKDLSFDVRAGKTLAIVGESGSGKSVTANAIMRLIDYSRGRIISGEILFRSGSEPPIDLVRARPAVLRRIRGNEIAMIFQDPMTSLNPVFTVGDQIAEAIILHQGATRKGGATEGAGDSGQGAHRRLPIASSTATRTSSRAGCASVS